MKLSPYLKINRIEFIVTYNCTGRCLHCSVGDSLGSCKGGSHVRAKEAVETVKWLAENYPVTSVMTFGGEPLLYPETVCAIHAAAAESGVAKRQIITNGYFSKREERIKEVAEKLADAGVNELLLSVDDFHQQRIPIAPVRSFAGHVKRIGKTAIRLQPAWLVNEAADNEYNTRTRQILAGFADTGIPVGSGNDIFMAGNALKNLAEYYPAPRLDMSDKCGSMPYTSPLTDIDSISITPNGDVEACSFVIGNIYREHISDIAARYDPFADEAMRAAMSGIPAMLELARSRGIEADTSKCYSICDVCRMINKK